MMKIVAEKKHTPHPEIKEKKKEKKKKKRKQQKNRKSILIVRKNLFVCPL